MKSGWPGVSIRLTVTWSIENEATADLIVIPRCRSSASESVCVVPASTLPISSMMPAASSSRSVGNHVGVGVDPQVQRSSSVRPQR
jgi:hypothetical protein